MRCGVRYPPAVTLPAALSISGPSRGSFCGGADVFPPPSPFAALAPLPVAVLALCVVLLTISPRHHTTLCYFRD